MPYFNDFIPEDKKVIFNIFSEKRLWGLGGRSCSRWTVDSSSNNFLLVLKMIDPSFIFRVAFIFKGTYFCFESRCKLLGSENGNKSVEWVVNYNAVSIYDSSWKHMLGEDMDKVFPGFFEELIMALKAHGFLHKGDENGYAIHVEIEGRYFSDK